MKFGITSASVASVPEHRQRGRRAVNAEGLFAVPLRAQHKTGTDNAVQNDHHRRIDGVPRDRIAAGRA